MFSVAIYLLVYLSTIRQCLAKEDYYIDRTTRKILSYTLKYTPDFAKKTFKASCVWIVKNKKPSNIYYFYSRNLIIDQKNTQLLNYNAKGFNEIKQDDVRPSARSIEEPSHIKTFYYDSKNPAGMYTLEFTEFNGSLKNNLKGFYFDQYPDENGYSIKFLTTQFGPFGASYAFPSFDEPYFRSKFTIIILRPKEYTCVISNAKLKKSTIRGDLIEDEFEESEKISPSSVTFTISKLQISKAMKDSIHRIVARPELLKFRKHEYAAVLINRIYKEIENFLKIKCKLKIFHHVALPSNRMKFESLGSYRGINHYKERVLLISNTTSADVKEESTIAIAKLIAQQWFLSYLMVDSWTMVWISEGLTMYLAYNVTNELYPNWNVHERLLIKTRMAMQDDSRCCCQPINMEARKPSEIESKFNRITVYKGAALITMMERLIPPNVFSRGLKNLIYKRKWSTYTSANLYRQFEAILELNNYYEQLNLVNKLHEIMLLWESQMGYPVVRVVRNYDTYDLDYVSISQMRFHFDASKRKAIWPIPINYATKSYPKFMNTRPSSWLNTAHDKLRIKTLKKTDWLILNNQATYYYRVHYDDDNWKAIAKALMVNHEDIHYLNRMQLIDDAFSLAEFGMLRYSIAFDISRYIKKERDYAPLKAMREACKTINKKLAGSTSYDEFQKFIKSSMEYIYIQVKYISKPGLPADAEKDHRNHLTVGLLFSWLCELNSKECGASKMNMYRSDDSLHLSILMAFQKHDLCTSMRTADEKEWNALFDNYQKSFNNISSQMNTFNALGCSLNSGLQARFLSYVKESEEDKYFEASKLIISQGMANGFNSRTLEKAFTFGDLLTKLSYIDMENILIEIGSRIITEKELKALTDFFKRHTNFTNLIKPSISRAKENIEWRKKNLQDFEYNLRKQRSSATKHYNNVHVTFLILSYTNFIFR